MHSNQVPETIAKSFYFFPQIKDNSVAFFLFLEKEKEKEKLYQNGMTHIETCIYK